MTEQVVCFKCKHKFFTENTWYWICPNCSCEFDYEAEREDDYSEGRC